MKLPYARIESFAKNPDNGTKAVLLYGPDAGLIAMRSRQMLCTTVGDASDPFRVVQFSFDDLKDNPARLLDEINAMSLFGGRRCIRVAGMSSSLPEAMGEAILASRSDTFVIFEAGDLPVTSSLRKFFEKEPGIVSLPCYNDDIPAMRRIIESHLRDNGFAFENDAINYLVHNFAGDRLVILSELEKLITYMGGDKKITLESVKLCIGDNAESSLDELCNAVAMRDRPYIEKSLNRILMEDVGVIAPIRAVMRYFFRMQQVSHALDSGMNMQQALGVLRPPIFFKQADAFKGHLGLWNKPAIDNMIIALNRIEAECKKTGSPAELILSYFLCITAARRI